MAQVSITHDERQRAEDLLARAERNGIELVHGPVYIIKLWSPVIGELLKSGDLLRRHYLTSAQMSYQFRAQLLSVDPEGSGFLAVSELGISTLVERG
jgi:hypothetical protein